MLAGLFGENYGLREDSCVSYKAKTGADRCHTHRDCPVIATIKDSYYVGGFYGKASELDMMKEIRSRGPIPADFNAPLSFSYYKEGIFSDEVELSLKKIVDSSEYQIIKDQDMINDMSLEDYGVQWYYLAHSIMIIGWGEENGVKYWICRNSYGPDWGEEGHFRIRRGMNDYGVESEPTGFIPELLHSDEKY